jgi:hypothetical protein
LTRRAVLPHLRDSPSSSKKEEVAERNGDDERQAMHGPPHQLTNVEKEQNGN